MNFQEMDIKELDNLILDHRRRVHDLQNTSNLDSPQYGHLILHLSLLLIVHFFVGRQLDDFTEAEELGSITRRRPISDFNQDDQEAMNVFRKTMVLAIYWAQEIRKVINYRPQHHSLYMCAEMEFGPPSGSSPVRDFLFSIHD